MKKVLCFVLILVPSMVFSQWSIMSESFDDYNAGELLSEVGSENGWGLWTGLDIEACVVSTDQFLSGTNSGHVFDDGTTSTKATWSWSDYSEGKYSYYMSLYIPEDSEGGLIGFHDSLGGIAHLICILGDSTLLFLDWDAFDYLEVDDLSAGEWHEIHIIFDLDNATSEFIVDEVSIGTMGTAFGATDGITFGKVQFGAYAYNPFTGQQPPGSYYIDDLNLVDELSLAGLPDQLESNLKLMPNPSNGDFTIDFNGYPLDQAELTITNMMGEKVYSKKLSVVSGPVNVQTSMDAGVYLIEVADATHSLNSRILIK
tara:strand:- start:3545 stop:4486 length:942 start_codon:yes stop_codon:yes gene_type:complete